MLHAYIITNMSNKEKKGGKKKTKNYAIYWCHTYNNFRNNNVSQRNVQIAKITNGRNQIETL